MEHLDHLSSYQQKSKDVRFTLIYDSISIVQGFKAGWGFSCLIEFGETTLLFDTGSNGEILLSNIQKLGIDLKSIQIVLISHNRAGHVGGLDDFLKKNPQISVYLPKSFPIHKIEAIKKVVSKVILVSSAEEIKPDLFTLGEFLGYFKEQAMALRTSKGAVVVTGCAHHGIIPILNRTREVFPSEPIYLAIGGFHFSGLTDSEKQTVFETFKRLKVQKVAPCHCCEEVCRVQFKRMYGTNYIEMGVGKVIQIDSND